MTNQEKMQQLAEEFKLFSGSKREFCDVVGVTLHTFNYWLKKFRLQNTPEAFIRVQTKPISPTCLELEYPNGVKIRLPSAENLTMLRGLITLF
jgi:hypothetical protein